VGTAALWSKGRITIPVEVRRKVGLKPGDRVFFIEGDNGEFILRRKTGSIMDLYRILKWTGEPVTIEEMNETIAKGWAGEFNL